MIEKLRQTIRSLLSIARDDNKYHRYLDNFREVPYSKRTPFLTGVFLRYVPSVLLASVFVSGGLIWLRQVGQLQFLELVAYDQMVRSLPSLPPDPRLLIVGITEADIQKQKQWPLSDRVVAQVLSNLQQHQPKVIGLDLFRDVPHPPDRSRLLQELKVPNVIVVNQLPSADSDGVPAPPGVSDDRVGFADLLIDPDNVVRRNLLYVQSPDGEIKAYAFSLQVSRHYLETRGKDINVQAHPQALQVGQTFLTRLQKDSGGYQLPPSEVLGWQLLRRYRSPSVARMVTLEEVLQGEIPPDWVKDKVVLIGVTAPSGKDTFATPYSATQTKDFKMPGVVIHAQMISQVLSTILDRQQQFWFWGEGEEWLWLWSWSLVGGILVWRYHRLLSLGLAMAIAFVGLWGICWLVFTQSGWIPLIPPLLGLVMTAACVLAYKVVYLSYHDSLTGLPNRRLFLQQLRQSIHRKKSPFGLSKGHATANAQDKPQKDLMAVLFLDLDRFKMINDGLGHQAGDYLLKTAAKRLQGTLNSNSELGRVGGDEFAIWLKSLTNIQEAEDLADHIQQELTQAFPWKGQDIFTTVSIGIAFHRSGQEVQVQELLRQADLAMNKAKELGKARHEMFVAGMDTQAAKRWQLETDLRVGLKHHEFQLYYQPIVSLKTRKIAGFEALVRWHSPERGFVSPGDFIPVAEETGLILPLGRWILQEACRQMSQWHEQFPHYPPLMISVNLSSRQFSQPDLVKQVREALEEFELTRDSLKLEITESMMMNDVEAAIEMLKRLKDLGLRLSIDDFGTGYSSLSYLHRFPVDTLKVDKSFVGRIGANDENDRYTQIVRTIVTLGHNLDLDVIAEGIETEAQIIALQSLNCEYGQGYLFSKPLPPEAATALLTKNPQW